MQPRYTVAALVVFGVLCIADRTEAANRAMPAGDLSLRQDIQLLADAGILRAPVTAWPLAWAPVLADLERADGRDGWSTAVALAAERVRKRGEASTRVRELRHEAALSVAEKPVLWRSFANAPRETGEVNAGLSWIGESISVDLKVQAVASPDDGREYRADGTHIAAEIGNYSLALSTMDRWWGPGWDGSLILSNNARAIPSLTFDRIFTEPFESRWLSWIGPWDVSAMLGQMEGDRVVPDARFFGLRFGFRPLPSLEIGLSRTAQWCGEGRPCDLDTFVNLLVGRDNRGDEGIGAGNEPGNQLAGFDFRWTAGIRGRAMSFYGQFIGEDEAGGLPSKFLGQAGVDRSGLWRDHWSWRGFLELASTKCRFYQSDGDFNCAYNHGIYQTGYRYRGRAVGHGSDNDSLMLSAGIFLADPGDAWWSVVGRYGQLNRGGAPDPANTVATAKRELRSLDVMHARPLPYGILEIGAGVERLGTNTFGRVFLQWRSSR